MTNTTIGSCTRVKKLFGGEQWVSRNRRGDDSRSVDISVNERCCEMVPWCVHGMPFRVLDSTRVLSRDISRPSTWDRLMRSMLAPLWSPNSELATCVTFKHPCSVSSRRIELDLVECISGYVASLTSLWLQSLVVDIHRIWNNALRRRWRLAERGLKRGYRLLSRSAKVHFLRHACEKQN